ncbi:hypothetical protein GcC1_084034, partial [Golovinomyces cichoracearum]
MSTYCNTKFDLTEMNPSNPSPQCRRKYLSSKECIREKHCENTLTKPFNKLLMIQDYPGI